MLTKEEIKTAQKRKADELWEKDQENQRVFKSMLKALKFWNIKKYIVQDRMRMWDLETAVEELEKRIEELESNNCVVCKKKIR